MILDCLLLISLTVPGDGKIGKCLLHNKDLDLDSQHSHKSQLHYIVTSELRTRDRRIYGLTGQAKAKAAKPSFSEKTHSDNTVENFPGRLEVQTSGLYMFVHTHADALHPPTHTLSLTHRQRLPASNCTLRCYDQHFKSSFMSVTI